MNQSIEIQRPGLNPTLRPYQVQAVKWMMELERGLPVAEADLQQRSDVLFDRVATHDGQVIFFNRYTGTFLKERPHLPPLPNGGILAEEMGLGKTVEMLALIMCHPSPPIEPDADLPTIEVAKDVEDKDGGLKAQIALKVVAKALKKKEPLTQEEIKTRVETELEKIKKKEEKEKKEAEKNRAEKEEEGDKQEEEEEYLPNSAAKGKAKSAKGKSLIRGAAGKNKVEPPASKAQGRSRKRKQQEEEEEDSSEIAVKHTKGGVKLGRLRKGLVAAVSRSSASLLDHDYVAHGE